MDGAQLLEVYASVDARVREWDGAGLDVKFAAFGLDVDAVHVLLQDRWLAHTKAAGHEAGAPFFVQGFVEGLLTGLQIAQERGR